MKTTLRGCASIFLSLVFFVTLQGCPPTTTGWVRLHGGDGSDYGYGVQQTTDGGYVFVGTTHSYGTFNGDMYLVKTNANGYISWYYTYGGFDFEHGYRVVQADDGGYVMAGTTSPGAGDVDACLVKVDSTGAFVWDHTYGSEGDDFVMGLAKCSDGGYILAGSTDNSQNETYDIYLVKTDEFGVEEWSKQIDYGGYELAAGIVETPNGYAVCGDRIALVEEEKIDGDVIPGYTERMCLVRTDADGQPKWMKEYGDYSAGLDLVRTADGGYIIAGASEGWSADPVEEDNGFAVKTDADGNLGWSSEYESPAERCWLRGVDQTSDGGYIFAGEQGNAALLLKCDEDGVQEWSRRFGGTGSSRSEGAGVVESTTGGYCMVGSQYNASTEDWSMYTIKTDANGNTGLPLPVLWFP